MGFELAGEIRDLYPDKAITIISSKDKLVAPEFAPKFHTAISYLLETANVQAWLRLLPTVTLTFALQLVRDFFTYLCSYSVNMHLEGGGGPG